MKTYEYKTIELEIRGPRFFGPTKDDELVAMLNAEGAKGWRYVSTVSQAEAPDGALKLTLVFECEKRQR